MLDNIFVGILMVVAYLILPPCDREDSLNCYWDASVQGNGQGQSFFTLAMWGE